MVKRKCLITFLPHHVYKALMSYRWIATGIEHISCCVCLIVGRNPVGESSFARECCVKCHPYFGASGYVDIFSRPYILNVGVRADYVFPVFQVV